MYNFSKLKHKQQHTIIITATMRTLFFTIMKVCLWVFATAQIRQNESKLPGLILDITESANGLLGEKTSIENFQQYVLSVINLSSSKQTPPAFFCEIEHGTFEVFAKQIHQIAEALHKISTNQSWPLVISWTVDITSEQDLTTKLSTSFEVKTASFPNIQPSVILNLHPKTDCTKLRDLVDPVGMQSVPRLEKFYRILSTISKYQTMRVGIGGSIALFNCELTTIKSLLNGTQSELSMYNIDFRETNGVTESLTLFKREVNQWDFKSKEKGFNTTEVIYRPIPESTGDTEHQRLLTKYLQLLDTDKNRNASFILRTPLKRNNITHESQDFQVIPHLNTIHLVADSKSRWIDWTPAILEATLKGFETFLLTYYQWTSLNSAEFLKIYSKHQRPLGNTPLKIIVDVSGEITRCAESDYDCRNSTWPKFETVGLDWDLHNTSRLVLEAFLFEIKISSTEQYKPLINVAVVRNMSSDITIGCSFRVESFSSINATKCVEACKTINGSLYVLTWLTDLELHFYNNIISGDQNLLYYKNFLKKELYKIKHIRDGIQREDPQSTVYFHVYPKKVSKVGEVDKPKDHQTKRVERAAESVGSTDPLHPKTYTKGIKTTAYEFENEEPQRRIYSSGHKIRQFERRRIPIYGDEDIAGGTLICNSIVQELKGYFEGVITWASIYTFPVILNSRLIHENSDSKEDNEWFSFLRTYPYVDRSTSEDKKSNGSMTRYVENELKPRFLNSYGNSRVETCIEWTEGKVEIHEDYFRNVYVGGIVHSSDVLSNRSPKETEFATMLKFSFHRFSQVEIVSNLNFREVLEAVKIVSTYNATNVSSTLSSSAFLGYQLSEKDVVENSRNQLLELLNEVGNNQTDVIKGIHIDLTEILGEPEPKDYLNKTFEALNQFLTLKHECQEEKNVKLGIAIYWRGSYYKDFLNKAMLSDRNVDMINKIDYIIFRETVSGELVSSVDDNSLNNRKTLVSRFSNHLRLNRVIAQLFPHVKVFFRLEVNVALVHYQSTMHDFLRFISDVKKFAMLYQISYFVVEAFDNELCRKNGWWAFNNSGDLTIPKSYIEREAVLNNKTMWYPEVEPEPVPDIENPLDLLMIIVIAASVAFLIFLILASAFIALFVRYKRLQQYLSDEEVDKFLNGSAVSPNQEQTGGDVDLMKFNSKYELQMSDLIVDIEQILGCGNFGTVYKGKVKDAPAAIKKHHKDCPKTTFLSFLNEVKVLCHVGLHPNVVSFLGAYTKEIQKGFLMLATELCGNGALEQHLRKHKTVVSCPETKSQQEDMCSYELYRFAKEIASGMEYIESKHVVHGDLSTRNVLLDENYTCKIGDFGLSRKLYQYQDYVKTSQEPLPWKWMAYESLVRMEFTSKSDVWSYGVTLWEIYSLGSIPYGGLGWTTGFADELNNGLRLAMPHFATEQIYSKMLECWNLDPEQRPNFTALSLFFKELCDTKYIVL